MSYLLKVLGLNLDLVVKSNILNLHVSGDVNSKFSILHGYIRPPKREVQAVVTHCHCN